MPIRTKSYETLVFEAASRQEAERTIRKLCPSRIVYEGPFWKRLRKAGFEEHGPDAPSFPEWYEVSMYITSYCRATMVVQADTIAEAKKIVRGMDDKQIQVSSCKPWRLLYARISVRSLHHSTFHRRRSRKYDPAYLECDNYCPF